MGEVLYINVKKTVKVKKKDVYVKDVAAITCSDNKIVNRINSLRIWNFTEDKDTRYIFSTVKLIELILKECPNLDISPIGETDFILEYEPKEKNNKFTEYLKVILVCVILFFGAGFTIMAFNNDISIGSLFELMYEKIMGKTTEKLSFLETGYCIGIFLGVVCFYNHFGKKKITKDPTPIEVEIRKYEKDVDDALIDGVRRKESHIDVGN